MYAQKTKNLQILGCWESWKHRSDDILQSAKGALTWTPISTSPEHLRCEDEEHGEGMRAVGKHGCILLGSGGQALKSRDIKQGVMCMNKPFWRNKETSAWNLALITNP